MEQIIQIKDTFYSERDLFRFGITWPYFTQLKDNRVGGNERMISINYFLLRIGDFCSILDNYYEFEELRGYVKSGRAFEKYSLIINADLEISPIIHPQEACKTLFYNQLFYEQFKQYIYEFEIEFFGLHHSVLYAISRYLLSAVIFSEKLYRLVDKNQDKLEQLEYLKEETQNEAFTFKKTIYNIRNQEIDYASLQSAILDNYIE